MDRVLYQTQEAKSLSVKVSSSEFPGSLSIDELFTGSSCSVLIKVRESCEGSRYMTTLRASFKCLRDGFQKYWKIWIRRMKYMVFPGTKLHQTSNEFEDK